MANLVADHIVLSSKDRISPYEPNPLGFGLIVTGNEYVTLSLQSPILNFERIELISFSTGNTSWNLYGYAYTAQFHVNSAPIQLFPLDGVYTLNEMIENMNSFANSSYPTLGFNIEFNSILSRMIITTTNTSTFDFTLDGGKAAAITLGFDPKVYIGNSIISERSPSISELRIFLNIDVLSQTVSSSLAPHLSVGQTATGNIIAPLASTTFQLLNNNNKFSFINFYQNSNYSNRVYSNGPIINTITVRLTDNFGTRLKNFAPWVMVLRVVRKLNTSSPLYSLSSNELPEYSHFVTPNIEFTSI
jgi:hypothetical protein